MIIASLGALKAGKPYAPVDISLPYGKAVQIVQDLQASLILTDNDHISLAHQLADNPAKVLNVEDLDAKCSPGIQDCPYRLIKLPTLTILPVPPGKPRGWSGIIGTSFSA